jgi:hypothetical protein
MSLNPVNGRSLLAPARLVGGWILLVVGLIVTPLPIPVGLIMTLLGLALLVGESLLIRRLICRFRARNPRFCERLKTIRHRSPGLVRRLIELTDPALDCRMVSVKIEADPSTGHIRKP